MVLLKIFHREILCERQLSDVQISALFLYCYN